MFSTQLDIWSEDYFNRLHSYWQKNWCFMHGVHLQMTSRSYVCFVETGQAYGFNTMTNTRRRLYDLDEIATDRITDRKVIDEIVSSFVYPVELPGVFSTNTIFHNYYFVFMPHMYAEILVDALESSEPAIVEMGVRDYLIACVKNLGE